MDKAIRYDLLMKTRDELKEVETEYKGRLRKFWHENQHLIEGLQRLNKNIEALESVKGE